MLRAAATLLVMRRGLAIGAVLGLSVVGTTTNASAADQPIAGQATLVDGRPLPQWGVARANGNFAVVDDNDFQVGAAAGTPTLYLEYGTGKPAAPCQHLIFCG